jgi:TolB-like protein/DNA-binding winged helix-turn-helix (wHTH) protein/Tfp pilus assembly protein PilF
MDTMPSQPQVVKFGVFEVDLQSGEVRKAGIRQKLAGQPFQVLQVLLEHPQEIVTREELRQRLWPGNTFVDYELALKKAVNRLRGVLGDSADNPHFIETVPRRGYRFLGTVEGAKRPDAESATAASPARMKIPWPVTASLALVLLAALLLAFNIDKLRTRIFAKSHSLEIRSIAVLPLENLSKDPNQDYFSDGITDALTTELAQIGSLRVISRTSAMHFKGMRETLPEIGSELNVDAVVEGSITRSENRVRITAQLIETQTDRHLWAKSYERELKDVLALQDEVARDISEEIRIKLTPEERTRLAVTRPIDPAAHEAYLRGRYWWHRRDRESELKGLQYFEQSVQLDPSYAPAWAGIADSYIVMAHHGGLPPKEAMPKAKAAAMKALELDSSLAEAHTSLALVKTAYEWDYAAAENEFTRAIELNPNYATAHHWYAHYLAIKRRFPEALNEIQRAHDLDPYSLVVNYFWGSALYYSRDYERALAQFRSMLDLDPSMKPAVYEALAQVYEQQGDYAHAIEQRRAALMLSGDKHDAASLANAYVVGGAEAYWGKRIEFARRQPAASALDLAILYARQGDRDGALSSLGRAYQEHSPWLNFIACEPAFDSLSADPRFQKLAHQIGLL